MLHLNIEPGDKILIGEGNDQIIVSFDRRTRHGASLGVNAPKEVPVHAIFADSEKQFKNRRKGAGNENNGNR